MIAIVVATVVATIAMILLIGCSRIGKGRSCF